MKVLVVGGGGREHAICWKLTQSPRVTKIYCAPGNGGIAQIAECVPIKATDIEGIVRFAQEQAIDLTFVAPDDPLAMGMVDALEKKGLRAFGPVAKAAEIEGSKVFFKYLMSKYNIPTAEYRVFEVYEEAYAYLQDCPIPIVIKADGLAAGKGVLITETRADALAALDTVMKDKAFGSAGNRVVIEEFMTGKEVSVLVFTDGKTVVPMVSSQDHKRALDGDQGLNTGGMGTFSPSRIYGEALEKEVLDNIIYPTVRAMEAEGRLFKGVLYCGLMLTENGPKVLEYNARFGDPETQVILPRLKTDLMDIIDAVIDERLDQLSVEWDERAAVCVVLASGGYPGAYPTGYEITGLKKAAEQEDIILFHAGTKGVDGKILTSGGRVLNVVALGETIETAREKSYSALENIRFADMQYRKDIARS